MEVGVFGGRSLFAIALAMKENGGGGATWGIDPWSVEAAVEGDVGFENKDWWMKNVDLEKIYRGFLSDILALELSKHCYFLRERGEVAVELFKDNSIDFFHLDSNHSELVSCRDVGIWRKKLTKNAVWVMDDTDWESQAKAVAMIGDLGFKVVTDGGTYQIFAK